MLDINVASGASVVHYREEHIHPPAAAKGSPHNPNDPNDPLSSAAHGTPSLRSSAGAGPDAGASAGAAGIGTGGVQSQVMGPLSPLTEALRTHSARKDAAHDAASALVPTGANLLNGTLSQGAVNDALERLLYQQLAGASSAGGTGYHTVGGLQQSFGHMDPALTPPVQQAVSQAAPAPMGGPPSSGEPSGVPRASPVAALAVASGALQELRNRSVSSEASNHEAALLQLLLQNLPRDGISIQGAAPVQVPHASGASGAFGATAGGGGDPRPPSPAPLGLFPFPAPVASPGLASASSLSSQLSSQLPSPLSQPPSQLASQSRAPVSLPELQPLRALSSSQGEGRGLFAPSPLGPDRQRKDERAQPSQGAPGPFLDALSLSEGRGIRTPQATASLGVGGSSLVSSLMSGSSAASEGITTQRLNVQGGPHPQQNPTLQGLLHLLQQARAVAPDAKGTGSHSAPASCSPAAACFHENHAPSGSEDGRAVHEAQNSAAATTLENVSSFQGEFRDHCKPQAEQCTCLSLELGLSLKMGSGGCHCCMR